MAIRAIRVIGDSVLNKKCKEVKAVNDRTKVLIEDMIDTMREANGVGLAAPQIGVLKRIVVIEIEPENVYVLINPVILEQDGEQEGYEGCLSVPGKSGIVKRPNHVKVKAFDIDMNEYTLEGEGLLARAICHECAHLEGELYVDLVEGELIDNEELEKMYEEGQEEGLEE
ncbi:peptide deformylase [Lachnoanaerobaculum sp. Marseille-Q4761]|jgi:peptide deformylase|uniref:peptide deformylase n=1 Tax=Lachnoanaerobaculum sp. Marseille-Q4761 TaxID=2819511 RepID=UPI000F1D0133|nr:peptide deformylase [Lachnoanaerobaculum sp. Marseille-Q4761]MBO1871244.1 peptide deformylase [Lachnoanaerobaculum sp. Marseille-Q4761]RKW36043.1 MAG: peptide deformylase [Lachnospiraceae bacterium]